MNTSITQPSKFWFSQCHNGADYLVSPAYGGVLDLLERYYETRADKGFKIKPDLALKQCTLAIPPSAASAIIYFLKCMLHLNV